MRSRSQLAILPMLFISVGCHSRGRTDQPQPRAADTRSEVVHIRVDIPVGDSIPVLMSALPPRAVAIRSDPDSVLLRVGDSLNLRSIRLIVLDSAGQALGRLPVFDVGRGAEGGTLPQAFRIVGFMQLVAVQPGADDLAIGVPAFQWRGTGAPPRSRIRVIVR
jgi:hypothetical protein